MLSLSTKRIALLATAIALTAEAVLAARGWSALLMLTGLFAFAAMTAAALDRRAVSVVLFCTYLTPAIVFLSHDEFHPFHNVMWFAALFGAMVPDAVRTGWHIPRRWRLPLVFWVLVTIASSLVVCARELDFNPVLLAPEFQPGSALGGLPPFTVTWVLHVTAAQLLGILWFDWLFAQGRGMLRIVVLSLAPSASLLMLVAAYQAFGEVEFLNPTFFGATGRASGTLLDANLAGAIGSMWIGIAIATPSLWTEPPPWLRPLSWAGVVLGWLTVLATGSRTAQLAGVITSAFALMAFARRNVAGFRLAVMRVLPATAVIIVVLLVLGARDVGPIGRMWRSLPNTSLEGWTAFAVELWNRNGYGTASTAMIREFPWFGIGIGSFQALLPVFAPGLVSDNAQNWYRHVVTELGVVGAIGPLTWTVLFAAAVLGPVRRQFGAAWPLRGILVSAGVVALVGMPGQDLVVALTLWTVAFWYATLCVDVDVSDASPLREPDSLRGWISLLVLVAVFAVGSTSLAIGALRPPIRSERIDWPYTYGFSEPEQGDDGQVVRWVAPRAVMLVDAPQRTMTLRVRVPQASAGERPVVFLAWVDGRRVMRRTINTPNPVDVNVPIEEGRPRVRLETRMGDLFSPPSFDPVSSSRVAAISWTFSGEENPWIVRDSAGRALSALSLTPNVAMPSPAGTPITWTATASGGRSPYSYRFTITGPGPTTVRDWSESGRLTWIPSVPGTYTTEVSIRNAGSTRARDTVLSTTATISVPGSVTVTDVKPDRAETTIAPLTPVTWTTTVMAGTAPYSYQFHIFDGTSWTVGRDWGPANDWTWTPRVAGTYSFQVWVRNAGTASRYDAWRAFGPITVTESR